MEQWGKTKGNVIVWDYFSLFFLFLVFASHTWFRGLKHLLVWRKTRRIVT